MITPLGGVRLAKYAHTEDDEDEKLFSSAWIHPKYDMDRRSYQLTVRWMCNEDTDEGIGHARICGRTSWQNA